MFSKYVKYDDSYLKYYVWIYSKICVNKLNWTFCWKKSWKSALKTIFEDFELWIKYSYAITYVAFFIFMAASGSTWPKI